MYNPFILITTFKTLTFAKKSLRSYWKKGTQLVQLFDSAEERAAHIQWSKDKIANKYMKLEFTLQDPR